MTESISSTICEGRDEEMDNCLKSSNCNGIIDFEDLFFCEMAFKLIYMYNFGYTVETPEVTMDNTADQTKQSLPKDIDAFSILQHRVTCALRNGPPGMELNALQLVLRPDAHDFEFQLMDVKNDLMYLLRPKRIDPFGSTVIGTNFRG